MAVYINDQDAPLKLTLMEGEKWWRDQEGQWKKSGHGWYDAVEAWEAHCLKQNPAHVGGWDVEFFSFVIYGAGGWHRYFVRANGEIEFSKRHSDGSKKVLADAEALGFSIA